MPRPLKCRRVCFVPGVTYFKPTGVSCRFLDEIKISMEELEAVRLKDMEGLEQEQGAEQMNISRPTFQRILASARQKIAEALLNGKAIRIEGGIFERPPQQFCCQNGHSFISGNESVPQTCPECHSTNITTNELCCKAGRHCQRRVNCRRSDCSPEHGRECAQA